MKVKILTAQEKILEEEAKEVVLPGDDGEFSVLDFHQPCIYSLQSGQIKVAEKKIPIKFGIAKVGIDELVVLVERV